MRDGFKKTCLRFLKAALIGKPICANVTIETKLMVLISNQQPQGDENRRAIAVPEGSSYRQAHLRKRYYRNKIDGVDLKSAATG